MYTWTVSAPNITGLSNGTSLSFISGTPNNPYNSIQTATYTVTPNSPPGSCVGGVFTITVSVQPSAVINPMTAVACSGLPFSVIPTNGTHGIVPTGTLYSWSPPAGVAGITGLAGASNLTNSTNASISVTYTIQPSSPLCGINASFSLVVTIAPVPAISSTSIATCAMVTFTVTPTNGTNGNIVPATTTYSWSAPINGNITGLASASASSNISGYLTNKVNTQLTATYLVTPSATYALPVAGACAGTAFAVTVTLNPAAQISALSQTICTGTTFELSPVDNGLTSIVPASTNYTWAAPIVTGGITGGLAAANANSISGTLSHVQNTIQSATYSITPRSALGSCVGTTITAIIYVNPRAAVTPMALTICSGVPFSITPTNTTNSTSSLASAKNGKLNNLKVFYFFKNGPFSASFPYFRPSLITIQI